MEGIFMFDEEVKPKQFVFIILGLLNIVFIGFICFLILERNQPNNNENINTKIVVEIGGEVNNPGVYEIENDKRLVDLVQLAGGFTDEANSSLVNLAMSLQDGRKYYIPSIHDVSNGKINGKININTASLEELMGLKGIGKVKAQAIIDYRNLYGPFLSTEEIMKVRGIGEKTYEAIKDDICCE